MKKRWILYRNVLGTVYAEVSVPTGRKTTWVFKDLQRMTNSDSPTVFAYSAMIGKGLLGGGWVLSATVTSVSCAAPPGEGAVQSVSEWGCDLLPFGRQWAAAVHCVRSRGSFECNGINIIKPENNSLQNCNSLSNTCNHITSNKIKLHLTRVINKMNQHFAFMVGNVMEMKIYISKKKLNGFASYEERLIKSFGN